MKLYNPNLQIARFTHSEETNTIEVVYRELSTMWYTTNPPRQAPDQVWKEIYTVVDGKITLVDTIQGTHIPSYVVEESITFNTDEK